MPPARASRQVQTPRREYNGPRWRLTGALVPAATRAEGVVVAARPNQGPADSARRPRPSPPDPDSATLYELLGVPVSATSAEITRSYREAMKRFHPDRVRPEHRAAAETMAKDLNRAYATLSNPVKRVAYDRTIRQQEVQDHLMRRYVSGLGAPPPGMDMHGSRLRRDITAPERKDVRRSERSAVISLFAVFVIITVAAIALILAAGLVSFVVREVF